MKYLVGQRVLLNKDEIGTVQPAPPGPDTPSHSLWVYSPIKGFASCYSEGNIKPLPNGQL